MDKLYELARCYTSRYPGGNEPYQIVTRLLEECGKVASEVNHFENSGIKMQKHGAPSREALAGEIKQAINALIQLTQYYGVEAELEQSIDQSIELRRREVQAQQNADN